MASPLARLQAVAAPHATNLRHEEVPLGDVDRQLLSQLDGSRDRAALVEMLAELRAKNVLKVEKDGKPISDPHRGAPRPRRDGETGPASPGEERAADRVRRSIRGADILVCRLPPSRQECLPHEFVPFSAAILHFISSPLACRTPYSDNSCTNCTASPKQKSAHSHSCTSVNRTARKGSITSQLYHGFGFSARKLGRLRGFFWIFLLQSPGFPLI